MSYNNPTLQIFYPVITLGVLAVALVSYSAFGEETKSHYSNNKLGPISISISTPVPETKNLELGTNTLIETTAVTETEKSPVIETPKKLATTATSIVLKSVIPEGNKKVTIVPFYSQFTDISDPNWRKVGCGIASLAMIIELYNPGKVSVDKLLDQGIKSGAYLNDAGWIHNGLIKLAQKYGLSGDTHDLSRLSAQKALAVLQDTLAIGPVMASVHYTFDPKNPIPHLVVMNKIDGNTVYYNDPSEKAGNGSITTDKFLKSWKKRYIEIRPV